MTKKILYIFFLLIFFGLAIAFPSFADNNINMNTSRNETPISSSYNSSYTPSAVISNTNDEFGLGNILNIMLVVIGILLILFAIAIIIRLKNG